MQAKTTDGIRAVWPNAVAAQRISDKAQPGTPRKVTRAVPDALMWC
jgi:hypothetical protein